MRSIHLIGVCGTAMGAFAGLLKRAGYDVRGSDQAVYPPMSTKLAEWGVEVRSPYAAENLDPPPDRVVVGNAVRRTNPEARAMLERALPHTSFPAALAEIFLDGRHSIVIGGTHGKTTTSALVAHILCTSGLDPSFLVGGVPANAKESFRLGAGPHFVVEGDEYDTAFFDKQPKFMHYRPRTLVLTSLEYDHADIYPDVESIERAFDGVVRLVPCGGRIIACASAPRVMARLGSAQARVETYGLGVGDHSAEDVELGAFGARFTVRYEGQRRRFTLDGSGTYNVENALAALAVAEACGVPWEAAHAALRSFRGVARRQTVRGVAGGVRIIDDFAHHPTAVRRTLEGLRARYSEGRLFAVFEPRTATSSRRMFREAYIQAFDAADRVIIAPVGRLELAPDERLDTLDLAREIARRGVPAQAFTDLDAIVDHLLASVAPEDTVVFMSNGGFGDIHEKTLTALTTAAR